MQRYFVRGFHKSIDLSLDSDEERHIAMNGRPTSKTFPKLITWSAMTIKSAKCLTNEMALFLSSRAFEDQAENVESLVYTTSTRRSLLASKTFAVIDSLSDLSRLAILASEPVYERRDRELCFVSTGQGAQYAQMGIELRRYPIFLDRLKKASDSFAQLGCNWDLIGLYLQNFNQTTS
jgi:acyl transferase domain-containing protein